MPDDPFEAVRGMWLKKIKLAKDHKRRVFGRDAEECMRFFNGPYQFAEGHLKEGQPDVAFLFPQGGDDSIIPSVTISVNKASECEQLFGPVLYHRDPDRKVSPRKPPMVPISMFGDPNDPMVQQMYMQAVAAPSSQKSAIDESRAGLMEHYLNFTPTALGLKRETRLAITEAIIKGAGVLWTEIYEPKGGGFRMAGSFWDTIDNLLIDPDCERIEDAKWIARRCCEPVWQVERSRGLPPETIKANKESSGQTASVDENKDGDYNRKRGVTNDVLVYWKIWSKMGIGARMSGLSEEVKAWDVFEEYAYLEVCDGCEFPLNLPPEVVDPAEIQARLRWQAPYWADDTWPCKILGFHEVPRSPWPMSHLKPAMGELRFINWAYSFIATKMKQAIKDKVVCWKGLGEEIKRAISEGTDYAFIELTKEAGATVKDVVQYLQHPEFQGNFWEVLKAVEDNFAQRTGLSELMYGMSSRQLRSAQEASLKGDQVRIRPDDMSNKVEDFATEVARNEALLARWALDVEDVRPIMGDVAAGFWQQLVSTADPTVILHQLQYRIEAGSARKPNRDKDVQDANSAMQTLFQPLYQYAMTSGNVGPVNALIAMWCKASMIDGQAFMLQPPPAPMMPQQQAPPPKANGKPRQGVAA